LLESETAAAESNVETKGTYPSLAWSPV